jgi:hypothetical protein
VYEIYKVGAEPVWADGLDLLEPVLGTDVAVIPHYDNAEGGNHDTRYCYLGEWRLAALEAQMPDSGWVLGVDEHTGLVLDLEAGSATVVGNGVVTIRRHGESAVLKSGDTTPIESLPGLASGGRTSEVAGTQPQSVSSDAPRTALHGEIRRLEAEFDKAVDSRDMESAVGTVLELLDTLTAWAGDTTQSDAAERGNGALRRMIVRLGSLAALGARDPREVVGTFVEGLLAERDAARSDRRYSDADRIRDLLSSAGIEVRDTPGGTEWVIQD